MWKRTCMTDLQINPQLDSLDWCTTQISISHSVSTVKKNLFVINRNPPTTTENKIQAATLQCTCSQNSLYFLKNPKFPGCLHEEHSHLLDRSIFNEVRSTIYNVSWRTQRWHKLQINGLLVSVWEGHRRSQVLVGLSFNKNVDQRQKLLDTDYNLTAKQAHKWLATAFWSPF